jgi:hypothetical protein
MGHSFNVQWGWRGDSLVLAWLPIDETSHRHQDLFFRDRGAVSATDATSTDAVREDLTRGMLTYDVILIEEQEERQDPRDMEEDRAICHMVNDAHSQPKTIEPRERVRCLQSAARQESNRLARWDTVWDIHGQREEFSRAGGVYTTPLTSRDSVRWSLPFVANERSNPIRFFRRSVRQVFQTTRLNSSLERDYGSRL